MSLYQKAYKAARRKGYKRNIAIIFAEIKLEGCNYEQ